MNIYGGTSTAVSAAVQARRMGKTAIIVCPENHLGGMTTGGLGWTDSGRKEVIGGIAREFEHRIWVHYQKPEAWKWQMREEYGNKGQGSPAVDGNERTMWIFEPHTAQEVVESFIAGTVKKSTETMLLTWFSRKVRPVCDGGFRWRAMFLLTLVSPMSMPSLRSSP